MADPASDTKSVMDDDEIRALEVGAPRLIFVFCADRLAEPSTALSLTTPAVLIGRSNEGFRTKIEGELTTIEVPDGRISGQHARIALRGADAHIEDLGSKNGTLCNGQRVTGTRTIRDGDVLELGHSQFVYRAPAALSPGLQGDAPWSAGATPLQTFHAHLAGRYAAVLRIAEMPVPVMIRGPSGVGKEVAAKAVHALSDRSGDFVGVNCGALPDALIESELFGVERGAFSGADRARPGLIRAAHQGTLFLDEIGELPLAAQVKLLRALQERAVTPVGGTKAVAVDFRLITATHRRLEAKVEREEFRGDLLARIEGFTLELPALKDRREDLGLLLRTFVGNAVPDVTMSRTAARALMLHAWPYNVRQLEKVITLGLALADGQTLTLEHLEQLGDQEATPPASNAPQVVLPEEDKARRARLVELLIEHGGNISHVAAATGKARMQIHRWMKRYNIDRNRPE